MSLIDAGLENLLKGQHALVKLSLKHFGSAVSLSGLKTVIAPQLNILNLKHCDGLTDAILAKLVQNCNCINKLVLTNCSKVTSAGIERVAELLQGHLVCCWKYAYVCPSMGEFVYFSAGMAKLGWC